MSRPIYLDYHATTPVDPRVLEVMLPYFCEKFGNSSSRSHAFGWEAEAAVEQGRSCIARLLQVKSEELVFTSGATESINLALKGFFAAAPAGRQHLVSFTTEHKATLDSAHELEKHGVRVTILPVQSDGIIELERVQRVLDDSVGMISVMAVNNEIGVIQPLQDLAAMAHRVGAIIHCDAAQALGKIDFYPARLGLDLVSASGHKFYAPKGTGFLWVRSGRPLIALHEQISGGGHEGGRRSGTLNVPGIVGLGKAAELCRLEMPLEVPKTQTLRDLLRTEIFAGLSDVTVNGSMEHRVGGNLNLCFGKIEGESLLLALKDVAVSSGSACNSQSVKASYVLRAIGLSEERALSSLRFGLGRFTKEDEVRRAAQAVISTVEQLRRIYS